MRSPQLESAWSRLPHRSSRRRRRRLLLRARRPRLERVKRGVGGTKLVGLDSQPGMITPLTNRNLNPKLRLPIDRRSRARR